MADLFVIPLETSILFPTMAGPMYIPINGTQVFPSLYTLTNTRYLLPFSEGPAQQVLGNSSLWFVIRSSLLINESECVFGWKWGQF